MTTKTTTKTTAVASDTTVKPAPYVLVVEGSDSTVVQYNNLVMVEHHRPTGGVAVTTYGFYAPFNKKVVKTSIDEVSGAEVTYPDGERTCYEWVTLGVLFPSQGEEKFSEVIKEAIYDLADGKRPIVSIVIELASEGYY